MPPETLEFEEPIAVLLKEIEALTLLPRTDAREREIEALERRIATIRGDLYASLTPWQRVLVARHPNRPGLEDFIQPPVHELRRDPRRPPLRRRPRDHDGLRRLQGPAGARSRAREGDRHQGEDLPQLRLRAPRGLPEGVARDAARREVPPSGHRLRRYASRVPGDRVRGARRGGSHRRQPARHDDARHADRRHRQRRGRQRRRARHRRRRPRADAGVRDLQRHSAGRVRGDPVARCREEGRGRRGA